MKLFLVLIVLFVQSMAFAECDNETVDSLTEKKLQSMAKRYSAEKAGMGVSIRNGQKITTSVAIFQGVGGNDGVKVDRIGSITVDLVKCEIDNTLIGTFDVVDVHSELIQDPK